MRNFDKIIILFLVLLSSFTYAIIPKLNEVPEWNLDNTITTEDNQAYIVSGDTLTMVSVDKFTASSNDEIILSADSSELINNLCFYFPTGTNLIKMNEIKINGLLWDTDLKDFEVRTDYSLCYPNLNIYSGDITYKPEYSGAGIIKYDVRMDDLNLDPYLIGTRLSQSNNLLLYLPFDNSIIINKSSSTNTISSANVINFQLQPDIISYGMGYGGASNPENAYDGQYNTFTETQLDSTVGEIGSIYYTFEYNKVATETGQIFQYKDSTGTFNVTNLPQSCFDYYSNKVKYSILMTSYLCWSGTCPQYAHIYYYCYDGADRLISTTARYTTTILYETSVYHLNTSTSLLYNSLYPKTEYFNTLNLNWSNSFYFWGNDSVNAMKNDIATTQTATQYAVNFTSDGVICNTSSYFNISNGLRGLFNNTNEETFCLNTKLGTHSSFPVIRFMVGSYYSKNNYLGYAADYKPFFWIQNTTVLCIATSTIAINDNKYHWICGTRNTTSCNLYLDGVLQQSSTTSGKIDSGTDIFGIANNYDAIASAHPTNYGSNMTLRDVKIYNRSLTYDEIIRINNSGNFSTNIIGENNSALYLNGNEYIAINNNSLSTTASWSICNFAKTITQSNNPVYYDFNSIYGQYQTDGVILNGALAFGSGFNNNEWHHSCITQDGTTVKSYVDGVYKASSTSSVNFLPGQLLLIGKYRILNTLNLNGYIDEFMVYNYALSQSEISTLYNGYNSTLDLRFFDEITGAPLTTIITIDVISDNLSNSHISGSSSFFLNSLPNGFMGLRYKATGYTQRTYYLNLTNKTGNNLNLYLLNSSLSSQITANIIDNNLNNLQGAYIQVLRYYISNNSYLIINQATTNTEGNALLDLEKYNEYYKFIIMKPYGNVLFSSIPQYVINNNLAFQVNPAVQANIINDTLSISTSGIAFNNATNEFAYTFTNVNGLNTISTLEIYKVSVAEKTLLNSSTVTSSSGTLLATIDFQNNTQYIAQALVKYSSSPQSYVVDTLDIKTNSDGDMGSYGLFLLFIMTIIIIFVAFYSIAVMVILLPVPLLLLAILGLVAFPVSLAIILEVIAIIVSVLIGY